MPLGIIYKATCTINDKSYVGKTVRPLNERIRHHLYESKSQKYPFHRAIRKYGIDSFKWETLEECHSLEMLNVMETFMIQVHRSHRNEGGYNLTWGGEGGDTFTDNPNKERTRQKLSNSGKGRIVSEETRKRISDKQKGVPRPWQAGELNQSKRPDVRQKLREMNMGEKNPMFGKTFSLSPEAVRKRNESRRKNGWFIKDR